MTTGGPAAEIGLIRYPGFQLATVLGLTDLFGVANTMSSARNGAAAQLLRISHWQLEGDRIEAGSTPNSSWCSTRSSASLQAPIAAASQWPAPPNRNQRITTMECRDGE